MIRYFDQIVLWMLVLAVLFCLFAVVTGDNLLLSAALAAAGCILLRSLAQRLRATFRRRSRRARKEYVRATLEQWLLLPEKETEEKLRALLGHSSFGLAARERLIVLPLASDSSALNGDRVLSCWRCHRGEEEITLTAFCRADATAKRWCERLERPAIRLADAGVLEEMLMNKCRAVPDSFAPQRKKHPSPANVFRDIIKRTDPVKAGFYAVGTLALYLMNGRLICLIAFGLFAALTALRLYRRADAP